MDPRPAEHDPAVDMPAVTGAVRASLRQPLFRRLLAALAISQAGNWLYNVALLAAVYERTHSAGWLAATTAARIIPIVVLGPVGGAVADRFDRRRVMIASDLAQAVTMLGLATVAVADLPIVLAPALAALSTAASAPYPSCVAATTPRLVEPEQLAGANSARSAVNSLCVVAGPALGGVLLLLGSPAVAFGINAASFAFSALLVATMPRGALFRPADRLDGTSQSGRARTHQLFADLGRGLAALRSSQVAMRLVAADTSCSIVYGAQTVLLVLVARNLGHGGEGYGWLLAACGLGGVLVVGLGPRAAGSGRPRVVLAAALLCVAVPLPVLAMTSSTVLALVVCVIGGGGAILVEILADTGLQKSLDEEVLGRAYGIALPAAVAGIVVGSLVAAPMVSLLGWRGALWVFGALAMGHALFLLRPGVGADPARARHRRPARRAERLNLLPRGRRVPMRLRSPRRADR
ncbi:MFS transporter [Microlunatus elymi]|uniref:MFS transporter n=1 Tax=Microlunatus elymi TaxID=2596828 RepID=A0A516PXY6_9ACTN|nr:MFS transporter [Microlunatus elymi]QDP96012.1 MFS transporter [Microlunatus elymi]